MDVDFVRETHNGGRSLEFIRASFDEAPVPERKYAAAIANAVYRHSEIELLFAQEEVGSTNIRSLVAVFMSPSSVVRFLKSLESLDGASFEQMADENVSESLVAIVGDGKQTVAFRANHVSIACANDEATMDFYQVPAAAVHRAGRTGKLAINDIVRVELRLPLFLGLVHKLRDLALEHGFPIPKES